MTTNPFAGIRSELVGTPMAGIRAAVADALTRDDMSAEDIADMAVTMALRVLDRIELMREGGELPDVNCLDCGERLCTVDDADTLGVLGRTAFDHECPDED